MWSPAKAQRIRERLTAMAVGPEEAMRGLAEAELGEPLEAAGAFEAVLHVRFGAGVYGMLAAATTWLVRKQRALLPSYPFLGVTASELVAWEFRFGKGLELKRLVGRWPLDSLDVVAVEPVRCRATVGLRPGRPPVELRGVYRSEAERAVVERLAALQR